MNKKFILITAIILSVIEIGLRQDGRSLDNYIPIEIKKSFYDFFDKNKEEDKIASDYDRSDWPHWKDLDSDCQDTRNEILIRDAVKGSLKYETYSKCKVKSGYWKDYYSNEMIKSKSRIDIDHIVPLKHAHENGGKLLSLNERIMFANDPQNLVVTDLKYNRSKGAKSPLEWMPEKNRCKYIKDWTLIKKKYKLTFSNNEKSFIIKEYKKCSG